MGDYHVHLHKHGQYDGQGPPPGQYPIEHIEAFVEAAHKNDAHEVGFTEHMYRCVESKDVLGKWWMDDPRKDLRDYAEAFIRSERVLSLERYVQAVVDAKDRGLPVLLGLEVDFFPETAEAVAEFLKPYPFDFLIASTHWIGAWGIDLPAHTYEFDRRGPVRSYEEYFHAEIELASSGLFDVIAHADVIKKQGLWPIETPHDLYEELALAASHSGMAAEVSTAGLHQPANEMYPARPLLQQFYDHKVPITIGSDAHEPRHTGRDRAKAVDFASAVGYTERVQYRKRVATMVPLIEEPLQTEG